MLPRIGVGLLFVVLLSVAACESPDPTPLNSSAGAPREVTVVPNPRADQYVTITVEEVTINRSGESPPNEVTEFRMILVGADGGEWSSGVYCPGDGAYRLETGQTFDRHCFYTFDERAVGDQFLLLFLGVDEDETSFAQDLGYDAGVAAMAHGLMRLAGALVGVGSGGVALLGEAVAGEVISYAGDKGVEWMQQRDVIGRQVLVLQRSGNWGTDQDIEYLSNDGGLRVKFHVARTSSARVLDGGRAIPLSPDEQQALPQTESAAPPTPAPPTPIPQYIERLVLIDPTGRELMTLEDGATVDLGAYGRYLDIVAEVNSAGVGSVFFLLDGQKFCPHGPCVENTRPYVMGGDLSGDLYGDWDWSALAGGQHTITAVACTHAGGEGECAPPVAYRVHVR